MVRVAVISDTHGDLRNVERIRPQLGAVDWLLHAGDFLRDTQRVASLLGVDQTRVCGVVGNCDFPVREPKQELVEIDGVKIWVVHGHQLSVKRTVDRVYFRARELGARVAVFGHSHLPVLADDGQVLLFNPGSLSAPRPPETRPSCGVLEIEGGRVVAHHIFLG